MLHLSFLRPDHRAAAAVARGRRRPVAAAAVVARRAAVGAALAACAALLATAAARPLVAQAIDLSSIPDSARRNITDSIVNPAGRSPAYRAAFDRLDLRARRILARIECARDAGRARAAGRFGPDSTLGTMFSCLVVDGVLAGAYYDVDASGTRVTRLAVTKLYASQARHTGPVDTARLLAEHRAQRTAVARHGAAYARRGVPYGPVVFPGDADTLEVWLVPPGVIGATGGRPDGSGVTGVFLSADGARVLGETSELARSLPARESGPGTLRVLARADSMPPIGALVLARHTARLGLVTEVVLRDHLAMLARLSPQGDAIWLHRPAP